MICERDGISFLSVSQEIFTGILILTSESVGLFWTWAYLLACLVLGSGLIKQIDQRLNPDSVHVCPNLLVLSLMDLIVIANKRLSDSPYLYD